MTGLALACLLFAGPGRADGALHSLWELHGKHNTVYLLGSIHVLRPSDYPLAKPLLDAYGHAKAVLMELDLGELDAEQVQQEMLAGALLPEGKTLHEVLGPARYARAQELAHALGIELSMFDQFAPWFVAEAVSQLQLSQMGFEPQSGVEMFFTQRAQADGKKITGLESVHDQIALFESLALEEQAQYLLSSLEEAHELPHEIDDMVRAWQHGDTSWFARQLQRELGQDSAMYRSMLSARNRKWVPEIESLLDDDKDYLVIVGTGHLVGADSLIELLKKDGISAAQR